ncbi:hypothetical protein [uncultured Enterovirga sp.]|uniref:hypothetical protein n=1 Tax=uncultured Enterovirga sp. TaxID=2026352 RepID=UPI0035CB2F40
MPDTDAPMLPEQAHCEIEAALGATARGRRFLADFARRSRTADTRLLLDAIAALARRVTETAPQHDTALLRAEVGALLDELRAARVAIMDKAADPDRPGAAGADLDDLMRHADRAAADIQDATEQIQETAWTMREGGFDSALCDLLDHRATEIYAACARHEVAARGLGALVQVFAGLEQRLDLLTRTGLAASRPPLDPPPTLANRDVEFVLRDEPAGAAGQGPAVPRSGSEPDGPQGDNPTARDLALEELARFDALDIRDKLRLFT